MPALPQEKQFPCRNRSIPEGFLSGPHLLCEMSGEGIRQVVIGRRDFVDVRPFSERVKRSGVSLSQKVGSIFSQDLINGPG